MTPPRGDASRCRPVTGPGAQGAELAGGSSGSASRPTRPPARPRRGGSVPRHLPRSPPPAESRRSFHAGLGAACHRPRRAPARAGPGPLPPLPRGGGLRSGILAAPSAPPAQPGLRPPPPGSAGGPRRPPGLCRDIGRCSGRGGRGAARVRGNPGAGLPGRLGGLWGGPGVPEVPGLGAARTRPGAGVATRRCSCLRCRQTRGNVAYLHYRCSILTVLRA